MADVVVEGHVVPVVDSPLDTLIQEPTAPVENGQFAEMQQIFSGTHFRIFTAGDQLIIEFDDDDGISHGLSISHDSTLEDITHQFTEFFDYVTPR